jgi:crotonobetainyl-CoA:carnitine CoA-transferase CaiB-like acyl-CoA transferase
MAGMGLQDKQGSRKGDKMNPALEGIKVVDVSQVAAVPMCARHLADFGADVVHIEHAVRGDSWRIFQKGQGTGTSGVESPINYNWENFNRNKRSLAVDLSQEQGQKIIYKLVENADVFVTNLRLYEREKFRMGYDVLSQIKPDLIYGSLTGYGKKGPDKDLPAYDTTAYWARSGIPHRLRAHGVASPGYTAAFGDNVAALGLAFGIVTSLRVRDKTGVGQEVDISLFHTGLYQMGFDIAGALITGRDFEDWRVDRYRDDPEKMQRRDKLVDEVKEAMSRLSDFYRENVPNPLSGAYETSDGRVLTFVILQPDLYWAKFCRAIEHPELENDPRFSTFEARSENCSELYYIFKEAFLTRTLAEWKPRLEGIPYSLQQNFVEVINDPQARENNFFVPVDHPTYGRIDVIANPVILSKTPATIRMPAPEFSQHTEEVLLENGYTWEDIARFKEQGVIA